MVLKNLLKRIGMVYSLNAKIKRMQTSCDWRKLEKHYSVLVRNKGIRYCENSIIDQIKIMQSQRGAGFIPLPKGKLRVFWIGANDEQDNAGFLQGVFKFGEVITFRNANGGYGLEFSSRLYDKGIIERNGNCLIEQIEKACVKGPVHLVMGQMWAQLISANSLKRIQDKGIITINVAWDDKLPIHWRYYNRVRLGAIGLAPAVDLTLQSSFNCCLRYLAEGYSALYWPMASDPDIFHP